MAASAAVVTRPRVPRQPACAQASTAATGSCSTIGTQSAVRIASTTPGDAVTSRSASATASSRHNAPLPVGRADDADRGAVHLAGEHEVLRARPESGRRRHRFSSTHPGRRRRRLRFSVASGPDAPRRSEP